MSILHYIVGKAWLIDNAARIAYEGQLSAKTLSFTEAEIAMRRARHIEATKPRFHSNTLNANLGNKKIQYRNEDIEISNSYEIELEQEAQTPNLVSTNVLGEIRLRGVLQKEGMCSKGTENYLDELDFMGQHQRVKGVLLNIDSPGGEVSGIEELAKGIANFRTQYNKPVFAYISDKGNSAAYWLASQCDKIYLSGENAQVGSIGTMICLEDDSAALEEMGIKIIEVRATESFNKNEAYNQALAGNNEPLRKEYLDVLNANFQNAVISKRGDKMPQMLENGVLVQLTGKTFLGKNAVKMGLADAIASNLMEVYQELNREAVRMDKAAKLAAITTQPEPLPQSNLVQLQDKKIVALASDETIANHFIFKSLNS